MNETRSRRFDRRVLWCGLIALAGLVVSFLPVPTTHGVKVPETQVSGVNPSLIDVSGEERIWRVWWRARGDLVDFDPQWLLTGALIGLLVAFTLGILAAAWFALTPGPDLTAEAE